MLLLVALVLAIGGFALAAAVAGAGSSPVAFRSFNARRIAGVVSVEQPGQTTFSPLSAVENLPLGSTLDTTHGAVELTTAAGSGGALQTGKFYDGVFRVRQIHTTSALRPGKGKVVMTVLTLVGKPSCSAGGARAARRRPARRLWGHAGGNWRTNGYNGSATTIHTKWLTEDYCSKTTAVHVSQGTVNVGCFVAATIRGASDQSPARPEFVSRHVLKTLQTMTHEGFFTTCGRYSAATVRGISRARAPATF